MKWQPIETAPKDGTPFFVKGGRFNTAYSQMHGFANEGRVLVTYREQSNPDVDPPFRVVGEAGMGVDTPTQWKPEVTS